MKHFLYYIDESIKLHWNEPALTNYGANTYTYGDVASYIEKYHILFEKCGISKGDKIALCAKNSAEWCIAYFAIVTYDAVAVPLLPDFLPQNIADLTKLSDSRLLLSDSYIVDVLKRDKIVPQFAQIEKFCGIVNIAGLNVEDNSNGELATLTEDVEKTFKTRFPNGVSAKKVNYSKTNLNAVSVISYTSGTSSSPKGVILPAQAISANLEFARIHMEAEVGYTILSILPLAHIFGQAFDFIFPFSKGCHIYIYTEKPVPARLLKALSVVKPFMFLTVPLLVEKIFRLKVMPMLEKPAMRIMMAIPGVRNILVNKVRGKLLEVFGGNVDKGGLLIGGAAINKEVEDAMCKIRFPYVIGYGMTECAPLVSYTRWQDFVPHTCGAVAHPYVNARVDSENPATVPGEIQLKGEAVTTGYYKNAEATAAAYTEDGWFKTGDMGTIDERENIVIRGRCKNMILTANGQNVYPEEIEELINQEPLVLESIVVGRKHGLVALLVPNEDTASEMGISKENIKQELEKSIRLINSKLPAYSKLTACEIMDKPFEKTPKLSIKRFMYK